MATLSSGDGPPTPRQIVPLISPDEHAAVALTAPSAHLTYHGGPLLSNVQVQAIFWGTAWQQPAQSVLIPQIGQFFTFILQSSLMDMIAEYGVQGHPIGHGQYLGPVTTTTPALGNTVSDAQIQQAVQGWIQAHTVAQPNANTLYFVYLPPGVVSTLGNGSSCVSYCGYHNHFGNGIYYAVEPFINCVGCNFGGGIFDSLTKVSSHELIEAITDPALNAWWDSNSGDEIGDICNGGVTTLGGFVIQTEWSNTLNACVIASGPQWHWANQFRPPGVSIAGSIGDITVMDTPNSAQRPYAFVQGSDGHLWVNWWDGGAWHWANQFAPPGVTVTGSVGVVTVKNNINAAQRPYVFIRGSDGHLWVNWWDGAAWHWANQGTPPGGVSVAGGIGALTVMDTPNAAQRPYAFVRGSDGHLWVNWWDGGAWHWANQGTPSGATVTAPVGVLTVKDNPNASQRPYAFVKASDGRLWVNWWDGGAWHWANQFTPPGVSIAAGIGVLTVMDNPNAAQRPYAFIEGGDGHLWVNWWDGGAWHWANQFAPPGGSVNATVGVTTVKDNPNAAQRPYAFVRGSDGHLWVNWWDGGAWHWANQGTPPNGTVVSGAGAITVRDNPSAAERPYAFVKGSDGNLWVDWWG